MDYLIESTSAASVLVVGVGRLVHDLLLWCTAEVGYLRLDDAFVQVSSIMPQKRNPVALEHARALASKAFAELAAVPAAVHNTPFGDIVDTEDDLQPLVATAFKDATRAVALVAAAMATAEFDVARMRARATESWVTVTELADTLARDHGVPFKAGHAIASKLIAARTARPNAPLADLLAQRLTRGDRPRDQDERRRAGQGAQPGTLHRRAQDAGRSGARGHGGRARRGAAPAGRRFGGSRPPARRVRVGGCPTSAGGRRDLE